MMLALGFFIFQQRTLPYQTLNRTTGFNWQSNNRVGKRAAYQYLGPGDSTIDIAGELYPELTGGQISLEVVRAMADRGIPWPLIDGTGKIYGMYIINSVTENGAQFYSNGAPRKISFTLKLTQMDLLQSSAYNKAINKGRDLLEKAQNMLGISA
ncbi:phage tail protein [Vagococcus sp. WN89Y]|uniref:phage tail protein n=1 Tax=Vagococcus sp. WN89Y TaxID=3457258 RepID=UPI003FCDA577